MNQKVITILFIVASTVLANTNVSHKRVKRMRLLTDTDDRTEHTDAFYAAVFSPEKVEKLFTKNADGYLIVRDESSSFKIEGRNYYWYGLLYSIWKSSRTCYYPAGKDPEMEKVRFTDGSPVKTIIFGCWKFQRCCGTDCCFETVIFASIMIIMLVAGIYIFIHCVFKTAQEIPLAEVDIPLNERRS